MQIHEIPRDYKGEGRILYIFSTKAMIYTAVGLGVGVVFYFILKMLNMNFAGLCVMAFFGLIGFVVATFKIPDSTKFEILRKTGGSNIDEIILRWVKFKQKKNRIYVYKEEETKDE